MKNIQSQFFTAIFPSPRRNRVTPNIIGYYVTSIQSNPSLYIEAAVTHQLVPVFFAATDLRRGIAGVRETFSFKVPPSTVLVELPTSIGAFIRAPHHGYSTIALLQAVAVEVIRRTPYKKIVGIEEPIGFFQYNVEVGKGERHGERRRDEGMRVNGQVSCGLENASMDPIFMDEYDNGLYHPWRLRVRSDPPTIDDSSSGMVPRIVLGGPRTHAPVEIANGRIARAAENCPDGMRTETVLTTRTRMITLLSTTDSMRMRRSRLSLDVCLF
ncbi:hypothetical protein BS47DRAFT_1397532 [Hydnum rufescens UP504]|uniref:Uncharacterized protein n=1 Tax=Hydnum rufescens UP504 TaxID=1448309 RepID=A0A9P6AMY0_9AGAM|nr:hypothetical protein BS47DRAFT_1397532 [Hydnum rufescens UP504]